MASTSQSKQGKTLRLGVIQNGSVTEETLIRDGDSVTIGTNPKNRIVLATEGAPDSVVVFEKKGDGFSLNLDASMRATITQKKKTTEHGGAAPTRVDLTDEMRGRVLIGDATILFQFVDAPPVAIIPPFPKAMKAGPLYVFTMGLGITAAVFVALVISGALHGLFLGLGWIIPPPPRDDGAFELNARLTRMLVDVPPEEPAETADVPLDDTGDLVPEETDETGDQIVAAPSEDDRSSRGGAAGGDSAGALTGITQVVQGSAFGALMSADGGLNLGLADAGSASERSAAEALANQQASGGSGSGVIASNLGAIGSGTGDGSGRIGVGGDGSSAVADAARAGSTTTAQEQVRVRPNVGDRGQRMAGSGQLSESEVRGVLGRFQRRVERCYERTLASNPSASGRVELQFRVESDGQTADARMPTNELGDTFGNCILTEVRRLRFSPPAGGAVTVSQRYILQPGR